MLDYLAGRFLALWRSRVVRWICTAAALVFLARAYGVDWHVVKGFAGQVNPDMARSAAFKLLLALVAMVLDQELLKVFDNRGGVDPKKVLAKILESPEAAADYFGKRQIAVALLLGMVLM